MIQVMIANKRVICLKSYNDDKERYAKFDYSAASDVFSFGATLYTIWCDEDMYEIYEDSTVHEYEQVLHDSFKEGQLILLKCPISHEFSDIVLLIQLCTFA